MPREVELKLKMLSQMIGVGTSWCLLLSPLLTSEINKQLPSLTLINVSCLFVPDFLLR